MLPGGTALRVVPSTLVAKAGHTGAPSPLCR